MTIAKHRAVASVLACLFAQAVLADPLALGPHPNPGPVGPFERKAKPFGDLPSEVSSVAQAEKMQGGVSFSFTTEHNAHVTLNITRPDGWVVRELIVDALLKAGEHKAFWDGRDNYGRILSGGDYRWRMLTHDGLQWDYIASVGNGGTPPWKTEDNTGGWGGNHGSINAVAADSTGIYIAWSGVEGPFAYLKRTPDGSQGLWGAHLGPYEGLTHMATDGRVLYGANDRLLRKIDIHTGKTVSLGGDKNENSVAIDIKPAKDEKAPLYESAESVPNVLSGWRNPGGKGFVWGLAAGNGRVFMSVPWQNVIQVFDAESLARKPDEDIRAIERPRNLVFVAPNRLFVSTEKSVQVIDLQTRQASPVITDNILGGFAMAIAADGTLFVSDHADRTIKRFSAGGKLLATLGKPENAPFLVPDYFGGIVSLAAAPDGSIWFIQDLARRVGKMTAEGKLLAHAVGGVNYAAATGPNPLRPEEVFSSMFYPVSSLINYDKQSVETLAHRYFSDPPMTGGVFRLGGQYGFGNLVTRNGKLFASCGDRLLEIVENGTGVKACTHWDFNGISERLSHFARAKTLGAPPKEERWMTIWTDQNGDGVPQDPEISLPSTPKKTPSLWTMAPDFTFYAAGYNWRPRSFTAAGVPEFHPADIVKANVPPERERWLNVYAGRHSGPGVTQGSSGYYGIQNGFDPITSAGNGFWSGRGTLCSIIGYDASWKPLWEIGTKAINAAAPGEMYYLWRAIGEVGDCGIIGDVERIFHVVHKEGFYVQRIMQDPRMSPPSGPDVLNVENFSGTVYQNPETGRQYLYVSSSEASHVFELLGLSSIRTRVAQPLQLEVPATGKNVIAAEARREFTIQRLPSTIQPAMTHGGHFFPAQSLDWMRSVPPIPLRTNGRLIAETRMGYTDTDLHICTVLPDRDFKPVNGTVTVGEDRNRRTTLGTAAFEQGDSFEISIGFDSEADPKRTTAVNGDARIIVTAKNEKGELGVYVMHPVYPLGRQSTDALSLGDGGTQVAFDSVRSAGRARVYRLSPGEQTVLVVSVPLASLDLFDLFSGGADGLGDEVDLLLEEPRASNAEPGKSTKQGAMYKLDGRRVGLDIALTLTDPETGKRERIGLDMANTGSLALRPSGWAFALCSTAQTRPAEDTVHPVRLAPEDAIAIDGTDDDWRTNAKFDRNITIEGTAGSPAAHVKLAWDDKALYARVKVYDNSPLKNNAATPELLLKGGDAIGFCFGAGAETRRILIGKVAANMRTTVYRPSSGTKKAYVFKSAVGETAMDYVASEPRVQTASSSGKQEYVIEAAIPWDVIGAKPVAGLTLPFDMQVIFSDPSGMSNAYNAWWHSRSAEAAAVDDLPTEAKLHPAQWGTLVLE